MMNGINAVNTSIAAVEGDGWDYKTTLPPKVTQEFKNAYYVNIKGTETVKVNGLLVLLHVKGFTKFVTELVEAPNQQNGSTAIFKATIEGYGWDSVKGEVCKVTVVAHGDANAGNCNSMVAAHYIRMAETRAIGRVLRNYLNVSVVTLEELDLIVQLPMMTPQQFERMNAICSNYRIDQMRSTQLMIETTGKSDINMLTDNEAEAYISALNKFGQSGGTIENKPAPQQQSAAPVPQQQPVVAPQQSVSTPTPTGQKPVNYNLE